MDPDTKGDIIYSLIKPNLDNLLFKYFQGALKLDETKTQLEMRIDG